MPAVNDADGLAELLTTAVCGVSVGGKPVSGTGWLASRTGVVLTAGHLIAGGEDDVQVMFPGRPPSPARVVTTAYRPAEGADLLC